MKEDFDIPELNDKMLESIEAAKQELGYLKNPSISRSKDMRNNQILRYVNVNLQFRSNL